MMKQSRYFITALTLFVALMIGMVGCQPSYDLDGQVEVKGYPLTNHQITKDFVAHNSLPSAPELAAYIEQHIRMYPRVVEDQVFAEIEYSYGERDSVSQNSFTAATFEAIINLAEDILHNANCFHIDPYFFVGLIQTESITFNPRAKSPRNAVGLTQFTSIAVAEVNHQLGQGGTLKASKSAISYYRDIVKNCVKADWFPIWKDRSIDEQKDLILEKPSIALTYGALLMHENLSLSSNQGTSSPMELYKKAFRRYNASAKHNGNDKEELMHQAASVTAAESLKNFINGKRRVSQLEWVELKARVGENVYRLKNYEEGALINYLDRNERVKELQLMLIAHGIEVDLDGSYGKQSKTAVCEFFQREYGGPGKSCVEGWAIDVEEWNLLQQFKQTDYEIESSHLPLHLEDGWKSNHHKNKDVLTVQIILNKRGYHVGSPDGKFGPATARQVKAFLDDWSLIQNSDLFKDYQGDMIDELVLEKLFEGKAMSGKTY